MNGLEGEANERRSMGCTGMLRHRSCTDDSHRVGKMNTYEIVVPNWGDENLEGEVTLTSMFETRKSAREFVAGFVIKEMGRSFMVMTRKLRKVRQIREPVLYECDPADERATEIRYVFRNKVLADKFMSGIKVREKRDEQKATETRL